MRIVQALRSEQGAEAILIGSAELSLLLEEWNEPFPLPRFSAAVLHARAIAEQALREDFVVTRGEAFTRRAYCLSEPVLEIF